MLFVMAILTKIFQVVQAKGHAWVVDILRRNVILVVDNHTGSVKLVQHYPKEIPVILFSLSMRISEITDRHSVRFSSRVSDS